MSDHLPPPNLGHTWIDWAMHRPRHVLWLMLGSMLVTVLVAVLPTLIPGGLGPLSKITIDVDPENMLEHDEPARVYHDEAKRRFGLHDAVAVGIVNEAGVFNVKTLTNLYRLTEASKNLPGVVTSDVLSLSTVDQMKNTGPGEVSFDWLMATPPKTEAEAAAIRASAERIPFLRGTLFAEDGKALVLYLPLTKKSFAHDLAIELKKVIATLDRGSDHFHIAGLPIAEETFGVEMFVQMAISAPLAMLVIFGLMFFFFRHILVIFSPMIIAMVSVLVTMGLLVATGHTIHIMSSMIPIFIMPIAVLDAVHIISDFFDRYDPAKDRKAQVGSVMKHLFTPMLFTSLTTAAGFGSLAMTPIPPVQVFGIFVAIGVMVAWIWTILFVPAYLIMLSDERLAKFGMKARTGKKDKGYVWLDRMTHRRARLTLLVAALAMGGAVFGMSRIKINDNPTRWFEADHPIRIADSELNDHFGGTYDAFLALSYAPPAYQAASYGAEVTRQLESFRGALRSELAALEQELGKDPAAAPAPLIERLEETLRQNRTRATSPAQRAAADAGLDVLGEAFEALGGEGGEATTPAALAILVHTRAAAVDAVMTEALAAITTVATSSPDSAQAFRSALAAKLGASEDPVRQPVATFLSTLEQSDEVWKQPELLAYMEGLQRFLSEQPAVGKSTSLVDIVRAVYRDLVSGAEADYRIPATATIVAQSLDQFLSSHRKDLLWHFVTPDYQQAALWVQLTSGDNRDMEAVTRAAKSYLAAHPAPVKLAHPEWFGLTYINVVWQDKMVSGMLKSFAGSFVMVLLMMVFLFRSVLWGLLSMIPLTLTVAVVYGTIGLIGKDYDMPVAVLSSLSLGLAVDYAIHFIARSRDLVRLHGSWDLARGEMFGEPARAIARNIIVIGVGFLPLLLAPLVPYQTVGMLIAAILLLAGIATLVLLPSLIALLQAVLFTGSSKKS